ncbi:MAG: T9SS type A sorting domain-containing protein, partial [bacterium]
ELAVSGDVSLTIYDAAGRLVIVLVNEHQSAGRHQVEWQAQGCASGIYYCRLLSGQASLTQKLVLLK